MAVKTQAKAGAVDDGLMGNPSVLGQRHCVILLHGIRTHAVWAEMVKKVLEDHCEVEAFPVRYGYLDVFRFVSPILTRRRPLEIIERELRDVIRANPGARISVIAHSFGTYAIAKILEDNPDIPIYKLVLCGSIVPIAFRWDKIAGQVNQRIVNDCGSFDIWPVLAGSITWGFGSSGTSGFSSTRVRSRFHPYKHSDFFQQEFVEQYWVPYFKTDDIIGTEWETKRPTPRLWQSLVEFLPLNWIILFFIFVAGFLFLQAVFKKAQPPDSQNKSRQIAPSQDSSKSSELIPEWQTIGGSWRGPDENGMIYVKATKFDDDALCLFKKIYSDFSFSAAVQVLQREASLAVRMSDNGENGYLIIFIPWESRGGNPGLYLAKRVNGIHTFLKSVNVDHVVSEWVGLLVKAYGPRIRIYLNGAPVIDFEDKNTPFTSGKLGFRCYGEPDAPCEARFDELYLAR